MFTAPSASWTTLAPESTANATPRAKSLASATKESATRTMRGRHSGQTPVPPAPLFVSAVESRASPVPCPKSVSSHGSLSLRKKSQPETSSTYPFPSSSTPSENARMRSRGSFSGRCPLPARAGPSRHWTPPSQEGQREEKQGEEVPTRLGGTEPAEQP